MLRTNHTCVSNPVTHYLLMNPLIDLVECRLTPARTYWIRVTSVTKRFFTVLIKSKEVLYYLWQWIKIVLFWITRAYLGIFSFFVVSISLTPQMLCAGVDNTILSGCHGDSGGPYVCLNADGKTYTLHGAVSWGSSRCDAKQLFTVFARVTQYRAWIKQHTGLGGWEHADK